jgi:hypothetical protein
MMHNKEVKHIMFDLIETFGMPKKDVNENDLRVLFENKDYKTLVLVLSDLAGLRIKKLKVIQERDLSHARSLNEDGEVRGYVAMPKVPPTYGTDEYYHYPWTIHLLESVKDNFDDFIYSMVHEMSHILLYSHQHVRLKSEEATDLMIIMLGFGKIFHRAHQMHLLNKKRANNLSIVNIQAAHSTIEYFRKRGVTGPNQARKSLPEKKPKNAVDIITEFLEEFFPKT